MGVINNPGTAIAKKSIPDLREAVRITKQLRQQEIALPSNMPRPWRATYFKSQRTAALEVTISNIRFVIDGNTYTQADQAKAIPSTDGDYYIYLNVAKGAGTVTVSALDTPAAASNRSGYVQEICKVTVTNNVISYIEHIWPGHIMIFDLQHTQSFTPYFDSTSGNLRFSAGRVLIEKNAPANVTDGGTGWDISTDQTYYVEITSTFGSTTPTITATIQTTILTPKLLDVSGTTLTIKVPLAKTASSALTVYHIGDIHLDSVFSPDYQSDEEATTANATRILCAKETNSTLDGKNYFYEGGLYEVETLSGEVVKTTRLNGAKFGGDTTDSAFDGVSVTGVNGTGAASGSMTITPKNCNYDIDRGLVQDMTLSDSTSTIILEAGTNINIGWASGTRTATINLDGTTSVTVVTDVQLTTGGDLQIKTRTINVPTAGTESAWTTVTGWTTNVCNP